MTFFFSDLNYIKPEKGPMLYDKQSIFQSIYTILKTKVGSRVFRPTWGGHLGRYIFEPCDEETARNMLNDIQEILDEEVRVQLNWSKSYNVPDPENSRFLIRLCLDIPGFSDSEKTIDFVFNQR